MNTKIQMQNQTISHLLSELSNIQRIINSKVKHTSMIDKQIDKWQTEYSLVFEELEGESAVLNALLKDQIPSKDSYVNTEGIAAGIIKATHPDNY